MGLEESNQVKIKVKIKAIDKFRIIIGGGKYLGIIRIKTGSGVMKAIRQIIYIKKNSGPRIEPCGTPVLIVFEDEIQPLISQTCSLLAKYDVNQSSSTFLRPNCVFILHSKIL